jgi:hypothetical protein
MFCLGTSKGISFLPQNAVHPCRGVNLFLYCPTSFGEPILRPVELQFHGVLADWRSAGLRLRASAALGAGAELSLICGDHDTCSRLVQAKWSVAPLFIVKLNDFILACARCLVCLFLKKLVCLTRL